MRRRRALGKALAARRQEALLARRALEDSLVALGGHVRERAENHPGFADLVPSLREAETTLVALDQSRAAEHDADSARMEGLDARLRSLEGERERAQVHERAAAAALAAAQAELALEERRLRRADEELRASPARVAVRPRTRG